MQCYKEINFLVICNIEYRQIIGDSMSSTLIKLH